MFFHCIIFTKQGQSHRPTGRGVGSRAATRKPLILLADSVLRTLGRGPWAMGRDRRRAGGSARTWAGIERQGIERQGIGPGDRAPGDRAPASSTGIEHRHRAPASSTGIERQGIEHRHRAPGHRRRRTWADGSRASRPAWAGAYIGPWPMGQGIAP